MATKFVGFIHRTDEFRRHSANGASVRQEVQLIRWTQAASGAAGRAKAGRCRTFIYTYKIGDVTHLYIKWRAWLNAIG